MSEQDSSLSSHGRPICVCRSVERRRSFVQHVNVQTKDKKKNISMDKKKNRKVISSPKIPLKSALKKKPSAEDDKFLHLKGNNNNIDKCDFNTAFAIAHIFEYYNESYAKENNNALQFAQTHSAMKDLKKFSKKGQAAALKEMTQLRRCTAFEPIDMNTLSQIKRKRAIESLIFLTEKWDGAIKG